MRTCCVAGPRSRTAITDERGDTKPRARAERLRTSVHRVRLRPPSSPCPRRHGTVQSSMPAYAVLTTVSNQPGILSGLTKILADEQANISYVDIIPHVDRDAEIYLEFAVDGAIEPIVESLRTVPGVSAVEATPSFSKI